MKPEIIPRPGGWEYRFDEYAIRLERIREKSDTISAEFTALYLNETKEEQYLVAPSRPNLMSLTAPSLLAKRCHAKIDTVQWLDYIEAAFTLTISQYRSSNPAVHIGQLPAQQRPRWRLEPLILDKHISVLQGHGDIGKSVLAAFLGLCVQQGWGQKLKLYPVQGNVLVLDYEANEYDWNETCKMLEAGLGLPEVPDLLYRRCKPPLLGDMEEVEALTKQNSIDFIIVDSAVRACGGEKEAKENSTPMIDALAGLGKAVLLINHVTKEDIKSPKKYAERSGYGSVFFWNGPRAIWDMYRDESESGDEFDLALFHRKHNLTKRFPPLGYHVEFSDLGINITYREVKEMEGLSRGLSVTIRIAEILKRGSLTVKEIAEETGEVPETVRVKLSQGKKKGMFVPLGGGVWGLASPMEF